MKAILIDPWKRSLETFETEAEIPEIYALIGENGFDAAYICRGEVIFVGDHSALQIPPLPSYTLEGFAHRLYGRGVLLGFNSAGESRSTKLSVDDLSKIIRFEDNDTNQD